MAPRLQTSGELIGIHDAESLAQELNCGYEAALSVLKACGRRVGRRFVATREAVKRYLEGQNAELDERE